MSIKPNKNRHYSNNHGSIGTLTTASSSTVNGGVDESSLHSLLLSVSNLRKEISEKEWSSRDNSPRPDPRSILMSDDTETLPDILSTKPSKSKHYSNNHGSIGTLTTTSSSAVNGGADESDIYSLVMSVRDLRKEI